MESAGAVLGILVFGIAWGVGVASWFLALAEYFGMWRFKPLAYRVGLVGYREKRGLPSPRGRISVGEPFETESGKFFLTQQDGCLFRSRFARLGLRVRTPFPLKGAVRWIGDQAHIECRIPIFPMTFIAAWLVGWAAGSIMPLASEHERGAFELPLVVLGVAAVVAMTAFSIRLERRRAVKLVAELEAQINSPAA